MRGLTNVWSVTFEFLHNTKTYTIMAESFDEAVREAADEWLLFNESYSERDVKEVKRVGEAWVEAV
jgi:hypothetical protein